MTDTTQQSTGNSLSEEKAKYLRQRFEIALNKIRQNRNENRRRATYVRITGISPTGTATLLLGLQIVGFAEYLKLAAFVFGSLATLLNALELFFNYRALWIEHEEAEGKLYRLKDEIEYYIVGTTSENIDLDMLDGFLKRYLEIWNKLSKAWIDNRRRDM